MRNALIIGGLALLVGCNTTPKAYKGYHEASKIKYVPEEAGADYWQTAKETKELGTGDCEDGAIYLKHLWDEDGVEGRVVVGWGSIIEMSSGMHAWNETDINGETYIFDPSRQTVAPRNNINGLRYIPLANPQSLPSFRRSFTNYLERLENE